MIMYSTITEKEYDILQKEGHLECDEKLAKFPADSIEIQIAYKYMADKLRQRYKSNLVYPRWAWTLWEGKPIEVQPEAFFADSPNQVYYRLKLDIKEYLLSDFDAWHSCLNLMPMVYTEEEWDNHFYWLEIAHLTHDEIFFRDDVYSVNLRNKVIKSWDKIFDIEAKSDFALPKDKSIQAVFWSIKKDNVLEATKICVDEDTYNEYNHF